MKEFNKCKAILNGSKESEFDNTKLRNCNEINHSINIFNSINESDKDSINCNYEYFDYK